MGIDKKKHQRAKDMNSGMDPHSEISRNLRAVYQEVESEEIPAHFLDLLDQLDAAERSQSKKDTE
ncbi:MAG: NepR family anti-sigma factor [Hyphomicrobiales bacterium]